MKALLTPDMLPPGGLLIACSSHEERCEGVVRRKGLWRPDSAILFHYDDPNPKREERHTRILGMLKADGCEASSVAYIEKNAAKSLHDNVGILDAVLAQDARRPIVLDISVFTKRHLLMMLRWLDDRECWDRLVVVYSEPDNYLISRHIPLSFGISRIHHIPGFPAIPDMSRPLHLAVFLGYEGDRALAVYEYVQPIATTLFVPDPPYKPSWAGRTEDFNREIILLAGKEALRKADSVDPEGVAGALRMCFGEQTLRMSHGKLISPLGTKPQTLGVYMYARNLEDPPGIVYASPLRHNHDFYSEGIGNTWLLKRLS